jgi:hypothetical protein
VRLPAIAPVKLNPKATVKSKSPVAKGQEAVARITAIVPRKEESHQL